MKQMKFVKVRLLPSLARGLNYKLLILTQPAAWCFCSSCIVNSLLPSCIWLCTLAPRCGWWTAPLGWSPWSALPPRCDILDTNTQKDYYIYYYMLKINSWLLIQQIHMWIRELTTEFMKGKTVFFWQLNLLIKFSGMLTTQRFLFWAPASSNTAS